MCATIVQPAAADISERFGVHAALPTLRLQGVCSTRVWSFRRCTAWAHRSHDTHQTNRAASAKLPQLRYVNPTAKPFRVEVRTSDVCKHHLHDSWKWPARTRRTIVPGGRRSVRCVGCAAPYQSHRCCPRCSINESRGHIRARAPEIPA